MIDRRTFAAFPPAVAVGVSTAGARPAPSDLVVMLSRRFGEIEAMVQGRLGVRRFDSATGMQYGHRSDERFTPLSSFKLLACGHLLHRVDRGEASMERRTCYAKSDLLLSAASRTQLQQWLLANQTRGKRLKAGLPPDWRIGDKTGGNGPSANDVAIVWPPGGRAPLLVATYIDASGGGCVASEKGLAEVGELLLEAAKA